MSILSFDAYAIGRTLIGLPLNGSAVNISPPFRPIVTALEALPVPSRILAWKEFLAVRLDADDLIVAATKIDPEGPPPPIETPPLLYSTLEDLERVVAAQSWVWKGYLASGVLNVVAAEPGTGKTRFAMDLARRLHDGLPWPDGQENTLPKGSRTLWIEADRSFRQLLDTAESFGIPKSAVALASSPEDPTGGLSLDDEESLKDLAMRVEAARPAMIIIDTVNMTTRKNLCKPEDANAYFGPLLDLASRIGIPILGLTHLSKDKEALGRRIVEKSNVVMMLEKPDPENQPNRRRLRVSKSLAEFPPALGITMGENGNEYDFNPPTEVESIPTRRGPVPAKLEACKKWLTERLTPNPGRVKDLRSEAETEGYTSTTFYDAKRSLGIEEFEVCEQNRKYKCWKLRQEG